MKRRYNEPGDALSGVGLSLENSTLLDFWKWAFCDLCDDDIKGVFAEWIVAKLLKSKHPRRISWSNSDLITAGGVRIEVKASAYWQSYKLLDELGAERAAERVVRADSSVRFSRFKAGDATGYQPAVEHGLKSDIYVFAFQRETDPDHWNAMDLSQWEFFVLNKSDLQHNSISLASLRKLCGASLDARALQDVLEERVQKLEQSLKKPEMTGV